MGRKGKAEKEWLKKARQGGDKTRVWVSEEMRRRAYLRLKKDERRQCLEMKPLFREGSEAGCSLSFPSLSSSLT